MKDASRYLLECDDESRSRLFGEPDAERAAIPDFSSRLEIRPGSGTPGESPFVACVIMGKGCRRLGDMGLIESLRARGLMRGDNACREWDLVETLRESAWAVGREVVGFQTRNVDGVRVRELVKANCIDIKRLSAFVPARDALADLVALGKVEELRTLAACLVALAERIDGEDYFAPARADKFLSALVGIVQESGNLPLLGEIGKLAGLDSKHHAEAAREVGFGWLPRLKRGRPKKPGKVVS